MENSALVKLDGISKRFPGVQALDDVSLTLKAGEVHGLVGENGAGKTTLMNIIGGVVQPNAGTVQINGQKREITNPKMAQNLGISFIHQERALFPNLDVGSNIFMADLPCVVPGAISSRQLKDKTREVLDHVGLCDVKPSRLVRALRPGEQQMVEIARSLTRETKILVFDEPTSSLTSQEIENLFDIIRELKAEGVGIFYVSHRLDEVFEICDRVTVLREGKRIGTVETENTERQTLVQMILGRDTDEVYQREFHETGPLLMRVEGLSRGDAFSDISFDLHQGEILGIAGLLGSGRTDVVRTLFGLDRKTAGEIWIDGEEINIQSPEDAIDLGIGFITEDRHEEGLILSKSVIDNVAMASLRDFATELGWMRPKKEREAAKRQKEKLNIVTPSVNRLVKYLSGGNQQKVVLGKWLETNPRICIFDEPTRGIDIGAKADVHKIMNDLAEQGSGIILISSDLPEVVRMSDRTLVMRDGEIVAEFDQRTCSRTNILMAATGGMEDGEDRCET